MLTQSRLLLPFNYTSSVCAERVIDVINHHHMSRAHEFRGRFRDQAAVGARTCNKECEFHHILSDVTYFQ